MAPSTDAPDAREPIGGEADTEGSDTAPAPAMGRRQTAIIGLAGLVWGLIHAGRQWATLGNEFSDPDDAMRLFRVRGLLDGKGWFDQTEPRLDPPGAEIHWSRIVDVPLALLTEFFDLFVDTATAERLTLALWPALLLGVAAAVVARLANRTIGWGAPVVATALFVGSKTALVQFRPGHIDHHNVQILLLLVLVAAVSTCDARRRDAVLGGVALAVMLGVGIEAMLYAAVALAAVAVRLVAAPDARRAWTRDFGVSTAAAGVLVMASTVAPAKWATVACDAFGVNHLAALGLGGGGLALVAMRLSERSSMAVRLGSVAGAGAVAGAVFVGLDPSCLKGPYDHIDPWLTSLWIDRLAETKSLWHSGDGMAAPFIAALAVSVVAPAWGIARILKRRPDPGGREALLVALVVVSVPLTLWQVRAAVYTSVFTVALAAGLLARPARRSAERGSWPIAAALLVGMAMIGNDVTMSVIGDASKPPTEGPPTSGAATSGAPIVDEQSCRTSSTYDVLDQLAPTTLVAEVDAGPYLLLATEHNALAASYHRTIGGVRDTYRIFTSEPSKAREIIGARGVTHVVLCLGPSDSASLAQRFPDGLAAALRSGDVPDWLDPVELDSDALAVFRVN